VCKNETGSEQIIIKYYLLGLLEVSGMAQVVCAMFVWAEATN
jgi:hypothetical protein